MLQPGTVLLYSSLKFPDNPPHPKIVVASSHGRIVLVYTSTKRDSVLKFCRRDEKCPTDMLPRTFVEAPQMDCHALDQDSWINCNNAFEIDEYTLRKKDGFTVLTSIPQTEGPTEELLGKIKVGILSSRKVPESTKAIVRDSLG